MKLFLGLGVGVEPFPYTEGELERREEEPFIRAILREGLTLYEAKGR